MSFHLKTVTFNEATAPLHFNQHLLYLYNGCLLKSFPMKIHRSFLR